VSELLRLAPLVLAFWGWALLAVAASPALAAVSAAAVGFVAAILARRAFALTAFVEILALVAVVALGPGGLHGLEGGLPAEGDARFGFVLLGSVLAVAARAAGRVLGRTPGA
jgi:hypothetical protein